MTQIDKIIDDSIKVLELAELKPGNAFDFDDDFEWVNTAESRFIRYYGYEWSLKLVGTGSIILVRVCPNIESLHKSS